MLSGILLSVCYRVYSHSGIFAQTWKSVLLVYWPLKRTAIHLNRVIAKSAMANQHLSVMLNTGHFYIEIEFVLKVL